MSNDCATNQLPDNQQVSSTNAAADDAVGMPSPSVQSPLQWYVALVRHNTEKQLRDILSSQGFEVYIATQPRLRVYPSGRKKWVEALVIPSKLFIKCTDRQRLEVVRHPFIYRFMTNPSALTPQGHRQVAVVSEKELQTLRFMLNQTDYLVDFVAAPFQTKDRVRIIRGSLKGLEGEVAETATKNKEVIITLPLLGSARVSIPPSDLLLLS